MDFLSWGDKGKIWERPKSLEFTRQCTREERTAKRQTAEILRGSPQAHSWVLISACMWGNCLMLGKEPYEKIRGNSVAHWLSCSACSHQPD